MKLELVKAPSDWLQKKMEPMDLENLPDNLKEIKDAMNQVMLDNKGIGLSANQVGLDMRLFVFHAEGLQSLSSQRVNLCINPEVVEAMEPEVEMWEGCLSFPLLYFKVKRPVGLVTECLDSSGKECTIELTGWNARIFGHEYDHLYGINYIDRVSKLRLDMAKRKQGKLLKRISRQVKDTKLYG